MEIPASLSASCIEALCFLQAHLLPETRRFTARNEESRRYLHTERESYDQITTWVQMLDALNMFSNEESREVWTVDMSLEGIISDLEYHPTASLPHVTDPTDSTDLTDPTDSTDLTDATEDADDADATIDCDTTKMVRRKRKTPKAKWTRKKKKKGNENETCSK